MPLTTFQKRLLAGLVIMAFLTPLGILLPRIFNSGGAWGEWGTDEIGKLIGYVPEGMKKIAGIWNAPMRDYNFGPENSPVAAQIIAYVFSGFLGIIVIGGIIYLASRFLLKNGK